MTEQHALAPDEADAALELPSRRVGRMLKAALRRAEKTLRKRRFQPRSVSCAFRVQARDSPRSSSRERSYFMSVANR